MQCRYIVKKYTQLLKKTSSHYSYGMYTNKNSIINKKNRLKAIIYFLQHTR